MGDSISEVFSNWTGFYKKSAKEFLIDVIKVTALDLGVSIVFLIIVGILAMLLFGSTLMALLASGTGNKTATAAGIAGIIGGMWIFILLLIPFFIIWAFASAAIKSTLYNILDNRANGKDSPNIIETAKLNFVSVTKYTLLIWAAVLVLMLPFIAIILVSGSAGLGSAMTAIGTLCCLMLVLWIVLIAATFLIQFAYWELIVNKRGVRESLKTSYQLVRNNFWFVLAVDLVICLLTLVFGGIAWAGDQAIGLGVGPLVSTGGIAGLAIFAAMLLLFRLITGILSEFIFLPLMYHFWKKVSG